MPSGVPLSNITISSFVKTLESDNDTESTTFDVLFSTAVCSHGFALMQLNTTALLGSGAMVTATQKQAASEAVNGHVNIKVAGSNSNISIPHTVTAEKVCSTERNI